jgi:hypothetical protein
LQNFRCNPASSKTEASRVDTARQEELLKLADDREEEAARIAAERLRKLAEEREAAQLESSPLQEAWSILMDGKKRVEGSDLPSLLDELGLEDAESMAFLGAEDIARVAALLRNVPRNKFLQLVARASSVDPPPPPSPIIGSMLQVPVSAGIVSTGYIC